MGLDAVEFVLALEEAVGISITDEEASAMLTPRHVVDYLADRLPAGETHACFSQRAFFRLRSAMVDAYRIPRRGITPSTPWDDILPDRGALRGGTWRHLQTVVGAPDWPHRSFLGYRLAHARTVGDTAEYLATRTPHLFKRDAEGWSRRELEGVVTTLIANELGVTEFDWDDSFVKDLGVR